MELKLKSYVYGLIGTDGNLYLQDQNRGRISLEINERDSDLVDKLYNAIPQSIISRRERTTNFAENYCSVSFRNNQLWFRQELIDFGLPIEDKTHTIGVPTQTYSENDFWRGIIDGDGSLGFIADGSPFVSLVTKSENLKTAFCDLLRKKFGIIKNINRNSRDGVYNLTLKNEDAILFCDFIYDNAEIFLDRKYEKYKEMKSWIRIKPKINRRSWTDEEIEFIQTHTINESIEKLGRTQKSIISKLNRLKN